MTPNDPNLSDCAEWQPVCESTADDTERSSLQRMVRRLAVALEKVFRCASDDTEITVDITVDGARITIDEDRVWALIEIRGSVDEPEFRVFMNKRWSKGQPAMGMPVQLCATNGETEVRRVGFGWKEMGYRCNYYRLRWREFCRRLRKDVRFLFAWDRRLIGPMRR